MPVWAVQSDPFFSSRLNMSRRHFHDQFLVHSVKRRRATASVSRSCGGLQKVFNKVSKSGKKWKNFVYISASKKSPG